MYDVKQYHSLLLFRSKFFFKVTHPAHIYGICITRCCIIPSKSQLENCVLIDQRYALFIKYRAVGTNKYRVTSTDKHIQVITKITIQKITQISLTSNRMWFSVQTLLSKKAADHPLYSANLTMDCFFFLLCVFTLFGGKFNMSHW